MSKIDFEAHIKAIESIGRAIQSGLEQSGIAVSFHVETNYGEGCHFLTIHGDTKGLWYQAHIYIGHINRLLSEPEAWEKEAAAAANEAIKAYRKAWDNKRENHENIF